MEYAAAAAGQRRSSKTLVARTSLSSLLAGAVVVGTASANGGYFRSSWGWIALSLAWAAVFGLGIWREMSSSELVLPLLLAGFAGWVFITTSWSSGRGAAIDEGFRTLIAPLAVLAVLAVCSRVRLTALALSLTMAVTAVCAYALGTRLLPDRIGSFDSVAGARLSAPIGYWNALGIFATMGILLAFASSMADGVRGRVLAGAALPVLVGALYFTFSRGAWIGLGLALATSLVLDPNRVRRVFRVAPLAIAPAVAVALLSRADALTHVNVDLAVAADAGHRLVLYLGGLVVLGATAAWLSSRVPDAFGPRARRRGNLALGAAAAAALIVALATMGGPVSFVTRAAHSFAATGPTTGQDLNRRLFQFSGSGRVDLWKAAVDDFAAHPLVGSGAGSYERHWLAVRTTALKVRDAHSLYLETLAELGIVGLLLLVSALVVPICVAIKARDHPLVPGLFGVYLAYVLHAGVDWDWEVPAVTITALFSASAILVAARGGRGRRAPMSLHVRSAVMAGAVVLGGFAFFGLVGNIALARSERAARDAHWSLSAAQARRATQWQPWSSAPWQRLGEAQLAQADAAAARRSFRRAISKDPTDWELWFDLSRVSSGAELRRALGEARRLNPLSPEIAEIGSGLGGGVGISIIAGGGG